MPRAHLVTASPAGTQGDGEGREGPHASLPKWVPSTAPDAPDLSRACLARYTDRDGIGRICVQPVGHDEPAPMTPPVPDRDGAAEVRVEWGVRLPDGTVSFNSPDGIDGLKAWCESMGFEPALVRRTVTTTPWTTEGDER